MSTSYRSVFLYRRKKTTSPIPASMRLQARLALYIEIRFVWRSVLIFDLVGRQVLGRTGPLPLILLPQFGGYWIEGTNHDLGSSSAPEEPPPCPTSQCTLETNSIAKIYRKDFLGKVKNFLKIRFAIKAIFLMQNNKSIHLDLSYKGHICPRSTIKKSSI